MHPFRAFSEVLCWKLCNCIPQFFVNHGDIINALFFYLIFRYGKRKKSHSTDSGVEGGCGLTVILFSQKFGHKVELAGALLWLINQFTTFNFSGNFLSEFSELTHTKFQTCWLLHEWRFFCFQRHFTLLDPIFICFAP